ncbi:MAG TPA: cytochrome c oxidase assembly protein, partial [Chloroflexota bacterium]|nr:cytochrome c oxidase assembly protein [Chloroflexota bacterium]
QHLLLIFAAAPLLLFGAPLMPIWRALPLGARRASLRWLLRHRSPRRAALGAARLLSAPRVVWLLFVGDFLAWHLPALYDLTLRDQLVHDVEHLLFLGTAVLFWAQVIPSLPCRPRLGYGAQAVFMVTAGMGMQVVELPLTYSGAPLYPYYAAVQRPVGGVSPLVDQSTSGALMNLVGAIVFGSVFMLLLWRWIDAGTRPEAGARRSGSARRGHRDRGRSDEEALRRLPPTNEGEQGAWSL